jgi:hypothetical protein
MILAVAGKKTRWPLSFTIAILVILHVGKLWPGSKSFSVSDYASHVVFGLSKLIFLIKTTIAYYWHLGYQSRLLDCEC